MQVEYLSVNNTFVALKDSPEGLDTTSIKFIRDGIFNGMDISIDTKLFFYCASGKEEIDNEYDRAFIDGIGEIKLTEQCNNEKIEAIFELDFSSYKRNSDKTEIGLREKNKTNAFKDNIKNPIEIQDEEDVFVRNLPLKYDLSSNKATSIVKKSGDDPEVLELSTLRKLYFAPEFEITKSELEDITIIDDGYIFSSETDSNGIANERILFIDNAGNVNATPQNFLILPNVEPTALFENVTKDGNIILKTDKKRFINISAVCPTTPLEMSLQTLNEFIHIGKEFSKPRCFFRTTLENYQGNPTGNHRFEQGTSPNYSLDPPPINTGDYLIDYTTIYNNLYGIIFGDKLHIKKGESLWIYYELNFHTQASNPPNVPHNFSCEFNTIEFSIDRSITIDFTHNSGVQDIITSSADIESTHTKIKAYKGKKIAETLFSGLNLSLFDLNCYNDLFFTDGIRLRDKTNRNNLKLTPEYFFDNLEKMISCGLGIFYPSGDFRLMPIEFFYTDIISLNYNINNIDDVTIEPAQNMIYNKIEIGYNESKSSEKDIHQKNEYNIINKGKSTFSKVTEFIASKYLFARATILNNGDSILEYDNNIFVISASNINGKNITLSQSSGFASDGVFENPTETNGMNRRYATIYNLFRHFRKWGFGLWKPYTTLENNSIFEKKLNWNNQCDLPNIEIEAHKTIVATDYETKTFAPEYISFQAVMGIVEFWNIRNVWYDIVQVNMPNMTYFGNIVSAEFKDGIVNFKLIKRVI